MIYNELLVIEEIMNVLPDLLPEKTETITQLKNIYLVK